jgi:hypothetical protein
VIEPRRLEPIHRLCHQIDQNPTGDDEDQAGDDQNRVFSTNPAAAVDNPAYALTSAVRIGASIGWPRRLPVCAVPC